MPTLTVDDVLAEANQVLDQTPDHLWWRMAPREVVEFAFPDWDVVGIAENANYNKVTLSAPRVLLRHKTVPNRWFLMWSSGIELLPGRMSTMGQFYRFDPKRSRFAVGTPDDLIAAARRRVGTGGQRGLVWWLYDTFTGLGPHPTGAFADPATIDPLWVLLSAADRNLNADPTDTAEVPAEATEDILARTFPGWTLYGLDEHTEGEARALLRSPHDPNQYLYLTAWRKHLLSGNGTDGTPVFRAGEERMEQVRATLATEADLLAEARVDHETWPMSSTDLWWLLHTFAANAADAETAAAYAAEPRAELALMALGAPGRGETPPRSNETRMYQYLTRLFG